MIRSFARVLGRSVVAKAVVTAVASVFALGATGAVAQAQATDQRERYAPLILKLPATARLLSLGGAQVAQRDVDAVFGNPALVGTGTALALGAERYANGAIAGQFASSSTIGPLGIGVGVQLLDAGVRYGAFPAPSEVLTRENGTGASNLAATIAASLSWKQMRWGVGATYVEERVIDARVSGVAFDIGVSKSLQFLSSTVAVAVQHVGPDLEAAGVPVSLPAQLALGLSTAPRGIGKWIDLSGAAQLDVRRDGTLFPRGGMELSYTPIEGVSFAGRIGGRRPQLREERAVTAGGGFTFDRVTMDYAWEPLREGAGHRLTLRVR